MARFKLTTRVIGHRLTLRHLTVRRFFNKRLKPLHAARILIKLHEHLYYTSILYTVVF